MISPEVKIFIVFSTFNGGDVLSDVLKGYQAVEQPECQWSIVAVDNASTDNTPDILRSFQGRLPLVVLNDPVPGKNHALNSAIDRIGDNGELFVFTDDDAIPDPDFLRSWEKVLHERPDNELFGGGVRPYFRQAPPVWLSRYTAHFPELYAQIDRQSGPMRADEIFGPNMAVRRSVLSRGHRFYENIGPNATLPNYPMGSEVEFCARVDKESLAIPWFADTPKVRHIVRPSQTTYSFIARRAYRHGKGSAMREIIASGGVKVAEIARRSETSGKFRRALVRFIRLQAARLMIGSSWWQYNWDQGYRDGIADYTNR